MRIAINGTGVAGPTLAWWLKKYGFEPILFESAQALRTGGYMIDFWGTGYDIAKKMGILPRLFEKGYSIDSVRIVDSYGKKIGSMKIESLRSLIGNKFLSIPRGDLAEAIYHACGKIETHFATHIVDVKELSDHVKVQLSDGSYESFDLVIGADGLHSHIRTLVFGNEGEFEQDLGAYVAAFTLPHYLPYEEFVYVAHAETKKMVARTGLRGNETMFLFTFRSELIKEKPRDEEEGKQILREVFSDMQWEAPCILSRLNEAKDFYFDHVSQIHMDSWSKGRVGLIGDAAACVSLFAGEGTSLAMTEAYVLAGELYLARGDYRAAFHRYEQRLKSLLIKKQKSALMTRAFFAPKNRWELILSRLFINASNVPVLSKFLLGQMLKDEIDLPDY